MAKSNKGAKWEREICRALSQWWSFGINETFRDDIFWRTAGSGGMATNRKRSAKKRTAEQYGDIQAVDPIGKPLTDFFLMELKRGYNADINLCTLVDCPATMKPPILIDWYAKMKKEMIWANRKGSLLFFKRDRRDAIVMMGMPTLHAIEKRVEMRLGDIPWAFFRTRWSEDVLVFVRLNNLLTQLRPKHIIDLLETTPTPRVIA